MTSPCISSGGGNSLLAFPQSSFSAVLLFRSPPFPQCRRTNLSPLSPYVSSFGTSHTEPKAASGWSLRRGQFGASVENSTKDFNDVSFCTELSESRIGSEWKVKTSDALRSKSRRAKRWLGQHFLIDDTVLRKIVEISEISNDDVILEIGPGTGNLTQLLLDARPKLLVAVEKDPDMVSILEEKFRPQIDDRSFEILRADVLKFDWMKFLSEDLPGVLSERENENRPEEPRQAKKVKLVANLPFNITTDVLSLFLPLGDFIHLCVFMLQDEAALRLVLPVNDKREGEKKEKRSKDKRDFSSDLRFMNHFVYYYSEPKYEFFIPRDSFLPPPNVDAALSSFRLIPSHHLALSSTSLRENDETSSCSKEELDAHADFFTFLQVAFSSKRQMLRSTLKGWRSREIAREEEGQEDGEREGRKHREGLRRREKLERERGMDEGMGEVKDAGVGNGVENSSPFSSLSPASPLFSSPTVESVLLSQGLPVTSRPEEMRLSQFISLFRALRGKK